MTQSLLYCWQMNKRLMIFESHQYFSIPVSCMKPMPPAHSIACPETHPILHHGCLLRKAAPFFLSPHGIVCEKLRTFEVNGSLCDLEHHALEGTYQLSKLLVLICIRGCLVKCSLGEAKWSTNPHFPRSSTQPTTHWMDLMSAGLV